MAAVAILVIPYLTDYFGAAQYGIVAFFLMLQSLLNLLDLGFSAAVSRDASKFKNSDISKDNFLSVLFFFFKIFSLITIFAVLALYAMSEIIVNKWAAQHIGVPESDLYSIFYFTSVVIGLRMLATYFRSVMYGMADFKCLAIINITTTTCKFVFIIPVLYFFDFNLIDYFYYQFIVQLFELSLIVMRCHKLIGFADFKQKSLPNDERKNVLRFAFGVGLSSIVWVLISNVDRLYTSSMLSLKELGYLHIVVTLSGVVTVLTSPVMNAVVPKVTMLHARESREEYCFIYRGLSLFVMCTVLPVLSISLLFGEQLLNLWFSDAQLAGEIIFPLQLYLVGNFFLALASMSYPFSFASNRMRLRNISSLSLLLFLLLAIPGSLLNFGINGISVTWATSMFLYWLIWQPILMRQQSSKLFTESLRMDLVPAGLVIVIFTLLCGIISAPVNYYLFFLVLVLYFFIVTISFASSRIGREMIRSYRKGV
jgi:O-antigen/teichoic acid export membrane protein